MTLFTPALLFFMPFWATAFVLQSASNAQTVPLRGAGDTESDEESCPTQWVALPFTPPPVHAP